MYHFEDDFLLMWSWRCPCCCGPPEIMDNGKIKSLPITLSPQHLFADHEVENCHSQGVLQKCLLCDDPPQKHHKVGYSVHAQIMTRNNFRTHVYVYAAVPCIAKCTSFLHRNHSELHDCDCKEDGNVNLAGVLYTDNKYKTTITQTNNDPFTATYANKLHTCGCRDKQKWWTNIPVSVCGGIFGML